MLVAEEDLYVVQQEDQVVLVVEALGALEGVAQLLVLMVVLAALVLAAVAALVDDITHRL